MPTLFGRWSVKAFRGSWHEAQETLPSMESRLSKKSSRPKAIFWALVGFSSGKGVWMVALKSVSCHCLHRNESGSTTTRMKQIATQGFIKE
jgi:hypothetical protein